VNKKTEWHSTRSIIKAIHVCLTIQLNSVGPEAWKMRCSDTRFI